MALVNTWGIKKSKADNHSSKSRMESKGGRNKAEEVEDGHRGTWINEKPVKCFRWGNRMISVAVLCYIRDGFILHSVKFFETLKNEIQNNNV